MGRRHRFDHSICPATALGARCLARITLAPGGGCCSHVEEDTDTAVPSAKVSTFPRANEAPGGNAPGRKASPSPDSRAPTSSLLRLRCGGSVRLSLVNRKCLSLRLFLSADWRPDAEQAFRPGPQDTEESAVGKCSRTPHPVSFRLSAPTLLALPFPHMPWT